MRRTLAVLAGTTLLLPVTTLVTPAAAVPTASAPTAAAPTVSARTAVPTSATKKTCAKKRHGVTVRIRFSDNSRFTRVRVSHPRGTGKFREPRVRRVVGGTWWYSAPPPDEQGRQIAGGSRDREHRLPRTFRTISVADGYSSTGVSAKFRLSNGNTVKLSCSLP